MIIWTTLRCLEFQIDQHEQRYNSDGVVSWELIEHMVRLAKRQAQDEAVKIIAAERETDQWRTRADEANARIRQLETELQAALSEAAQAGARWADVVSASTADAKRLREYEQTTAQLNAEIARLKTKLIPTKWSTDLEKAHAEIVALRKQRDEATRDCIRLNAEQVRQFVHLQAANADAVALRRCLGQICAQFAQMDDPQQTDLSLLLKIRSAVAEFDARDRPQPPTESPPAVTEPLNDSTGTDGPGQS